MKCVDTAVLQARLARHGKTATKSLLTWWWFYHEIENFIIRSARFYHAAEL